MELKVIAYIETDFPTKFGVPRQSGIIENLKGRIIFNREYRNSEAFKGLEEYSHIWLLWNFSLSEKDTFSSTVRPPKLGGNKRVGVFASRSPFRPNPIGLSCVKLDKIIYDEKYATVLYVSGADLVNGTPIYDIKPYIPYTDSHPEATGGFSADALKARVKVDFPDELISLLPEEIRETVIDVLAQDPHPAYKNEPDRVYYMEFSDYEIGFTACDGLIRVCKCSAK